jgi:hypothetical protein
LRPYWWLQSRREPRSIKLPRTKPHCSRRGVYSFRRLFRFCRYNNQTYDGNR